MATQAEIDAAAQAMSASKAWPVVFGAGSAQILARAALEAAERIRTDRKSRLLGCDNGNAP